LAVDSRRLLTVPLVLISATLFLGALVPNLFLLAPRYLAGRGYDEQQIGIVMGSFNVASLLLTPLIGRLIERFGHRPVLLCGCAIAAAGCLAFDQASGTVTYAAARATQGIGFASILVGSASYVAEIAPPTRLAQALGIAGVLFLCSQAFGPFVGEVIEHAAGWRAVFWAGALGAGAGASVAAVLPPANAPEPGGDAGRVSAWPVLFAIALAGFGFGAVFTFLADYADRADVGAVTPFFLPYVIAAIGVRVLFGDLPDRFGRRVVAVPALLCHTLALALMAGLETRWQLMVNGALFGVAHGFYYPTLQAMVVERAAGARSRAIASSTFAFGAGIVTSAFALGALAKAFDYPIIYLVAAVAGLASALVVWARS